MKHVALVMIYPFNVDTSCRFRLFVDYISPPCLKMERVINRSIYIIGTLRT